MHLLPIVDTHVHLYDLERRRHPWLDHAPQINRSFFLDDYAAAIRTAPVEQFVFVEAAALVETAIEEARWVERHCAGDAGARGPTLGAIVAQARVELGAAVEDELSALVEIQRVTGIRRIIAAPFQADPDFCLRPSFIEGVRRLGRYDLSFDIGISPGYLPAVTQFARQCEDVRLVLNHLGLPLVKEAILEPWCQHLQELAAMPHVHCKISGLLMQAGASWSTPAIAPYVLEAVDAFGFDRVMFGSDFPAQNPVGSFTSWLEVVSGILSGAADHELRRFFWDNGRRFYRIP
jgi:L-fuconolactonase